jgi:hypothetical protein
LELNCENELDIIYTTEYHSVLLDLIKYNRYYCQKYYIIPRGYKIIIISSKKDTIKVTEQKKKKKKKKKKKIFFWYHVLLLWFIATF